MELSVAAQAIPVLSARAVAITTLRDRPDYSRFPRNLILLLISFSPPLRNFLPLLRLPS